MASTSSRLPTAIDFEAATSSDGLQMQIRKLEEKIKEINENIIKKTAELSTAIEENKNKQIITVIRRYILLLQNQKQNTIGLLERLKATDRQLNQSNKVLAEVQKRRQPPSTLTTSDLPGSSRSATQTIPEQIAKLKEQQEKVLRNTELTLEQKTGLFKEYQRRLSILENPIALTQPIRRLPPISREPTSSPLISHPIDENAELAELGPISEEAAQEAQIIAKLEADLTAAEDDKTAEEELEEAEEADNRIKANLIAQIVSIITTIIPLIQSPRQNPSRQGLTEQLESALNGLGSSINFTSNDQIINEVLNDQAFQDIYNTIKNKIKEGQTFQARKVEYDKFANALSDALKNIQSKIRPSSGGVKRGGVMLMDQILAKVESENRITIDDTIKGDFIQYYNEAVRMNNNPAEFNTKPKSDQIDFIQKCIRSFQALVDDINTQLNTSSGGQKYNLNIVFNSRNMYKSGGLKNKSRKMKGGANITVIDTAVIDSLDGTLKDFAEALNKEIIKYNDEEANPDMQKTLLLPIASAIVKVLEELNKEVAVAAPAAAAAGEEAAAPTEEEARAARAEAIANIQGLQDQIDALDPTDPTNTAELSRLQGKLDAAKTTARALGITVEGGRKKKAATRKVKRGGAIDMSKLYNVSGLIVDSKDPVAMAAQVGQDSTPMPFSASGQGISYSAGIPEQFMRDLNPTLGMAGGKKRTAGSAKTQDKQRAGSAKTKTQDKQRAGSAKTHDKKTKESAKTKSKK